MSADQGPGCSDDSPLIAARPQPGLHPASVPGPNLLATTSSTTRSPPRTSDQTAAVGRGEQRLRKAATRPAATLYRYRGVHGGQCRHGALCPSLSQTSAVAGAHRLKGPVTGAADRDRSAAGAGVLGPPAIEARAGRPRTHPTTDGRPPHDRGDSGQYGRDRGRGVLPRVRRPAVTAQTTAPHTANPSNESPPGGSGSAPLRHLPQEGSPAQCGALAGPLPVESSRSPTSPP